MLAENVSDSLCLNRVSDLSITLLAFLHEKIEIYSCIERIPRTLVPVP